MDSHFRHLVFDGEGIEPAFLRQSPHFYQIVYYTRVRQRTVCYCVRVAAGKYGRDTKVDGRGQAPVEAHLFPAVVPAQGKGGVIKEGKPHRLLEFVDHVSGQKHAGDVALQHCSPKSAMAVALWSGKRVEQSGEGRGAGRCVGRIAVGTHEWTVLCIWQKPTYL